MSHEPAHTPHGDGGEDKLASFLSTAQFLVTGLILAVVATLAYIAGTHSAKGGGHGGEAASAAAHTVDVSALLVANPDILAKGKAAFMINCASCHGTTGHGDGSAAAALNPKPRNFTEGYWRYGGGLARVTKTITEGSPGTGMASFIALPLEDRIELAHYVRSLAPKLEEDKAEDLAWLQPAGPPGSSGGAAAGGGTPEPAGPVIPIEKAMAALAEAEPPVGAATAPAAPQAGSGLYAERCAQCHGTAGQGGVRIGMLGSAPYAYVVTRSLGAPTGDWADRYESFEKVIILGLPGYAMPGNGDLSRAEIRDLYLYTQALRDKQESAGRSRS